MDARRGDAQAQLDLPALDPHVFQDQAQQLLAALEVQPVQARQRPRGEGLDALAEAVVLGQLGPLCNQRLALVVDASATGVKLGGPAGHVGGPDHPGLVEVGQTAPLGLRGLGAAIQAGQLGREQLVVGDGCLRGHRRLSGGQQLGPREQGADVVEDEGVQLLSPDAPLGAAAVLPPARTGS